jgi:hypothetical protein
MLSFLNKTNTIFSKNINNDNFNSIYSIEKSIINLNLNDFISLLEVEKNSYVYKEIIIDIFYYSNDCLFSEHIDMIHHLLSLKPELIDLYLNIINDNDFFITDINEKEVFKKILNTQLIKNKINSF